MGTSCSAKSSDHHPKKGNTEILYIITTYYNPRRYNIRPKLYEAFKSKIQSFQTQNVELITIECAFENQPFEVTKPYNEPYEIQVQAPHALSIKENLLNIALKKIETDEKFKKNGQYIAWIDYDIDLVDPLWVGKIKGSLTKNSIVQIFKSCQFLGMHNEIVEIRTSFASTYLSSPHDIRNPSIDTGYGWATTKEKLLKFDDFFYQGNVVGLGDRHMAFGLTGNLNGGFSPNYKMSPGYEKSVFDWIVKAEEVFNKKVGFVDMIIRHQWHGQKDKRNEKMRWQMLADCNYDPNADLQVLANGVVQLKWHKEGLNKVIAEWFGQRAEDEIFIPGGKKEVISGNQWKGADSHAVENKPYQAENKPHQAENKPHQAENKPQPIFKKKPKEHVHHQNFNQLY